MPALFLEKPFPNGLDHAVVRACVGQVRSMHGTDCMAGIRGYRGYRRRDRERACDHAVARLERLNLGCRGVTVAGGASRTPFAA
mgnify:CR=1 FL=1